MEQFKRAQVVKITTTNKENALKGYNDNSLIFKHTANYKTIDAEEGFTKFFHLYIVVQEEIKEGDWFVRDFDNVIIKANSNSDHKEYNCKKIIASTDTSCNYIIHDDTVPYPKGSQVRLPQPSQQFIDKYIESYNIGNIITDVLVEYEYLLDDNTVIPYWKLKVNPKDNTITIKKLKDSWNREEVIGLLRKILSTNDIHIAKYPDGSIDAVDDEDFNNWITKNL